MASGANWASAQCLFAFTCEGEAIPLTPRKNAEPSSGEIIVDARAMRCPWPVLRAARAMRNSTHVVLWSDDPIALKDVPAMVNARGWQCSIRQDEGHATFTIKK
ncbi:MAG TPA: sulfurtransferase TusA family protein [Sphingobium sp.]